jgi:hypothetical protein
MSRLDLPEGTLVGRDRELAFLRGFFQEAAVSGGAVLLSGAPHGLANISAYKDTFDADLLDFLRGDPVPALCGAGESTRLPGGRH